MLYRQSSTVYAGLPVLRALIQGQRNLSPETKIGIDGGALRQGLLAAASVHASRNKPTMIQDDTGMNNSPERSTGSRERETGGDPRS